MNLLEINSAMIEVIDQELAERQLGEEGNPESEEST
jgi:hypothetical protein